MDSCNAVHSSDYVAEAEKTINVPLHHIVIKDLHH